MNTLRVHFPDEIEALKPLLRTAYQSILEYQNDRTPKHEQRMREAIRATLPILEIFKHEIPNYKRHYIEVLESEHLTPHDLIVCFDRGIFELHARVECNHWAHLPWSKHLRALLDERQALEQPKRSAGDETFLVSGNGVSLGMVEGRARVILDAAYGTLERGDILVTPMTHPDVMRVMDRVAGIVTDRGGVLCHAAIVAREFQKPCIVGCGQATTLIGDGTRVRVDAAAGVVTAVR